MRIVLSEPSMDEFISAGEITAAFVDIPRLRVELQKLIDGLDEFIQSGPDTWLLSETDKAMAKYIHERDGR